MHLLMSVFHGRIQMVERKNNSVAKVLENLEVVHKVLVERKNENFMFLTVKRLLVKKEKRNMKMNVTIFFPKLQTRMRNVWGYLCKWMKPMEKFACFKWMTLNEIPSWKDVEIFLEYLIGKVVDVDNAKCYDQICNLKQFVESYLQDEEFIKLPMRKQWCKYFDQCKNILCHSEILRIVQFFFAVTSHNANAERVFSHDAKSEV